MKVAYFSPLPPERSGIADYSALLLPELSKRIEVEVIPRGSRRPPRGTDVCLYHIGNNAAAHGWIVEAARRHRGVVVLHDFVLHHLVAGLTVARGDGEGYRAAMERDGGPVGRLLAHGVLDSVLPPLWEFRPHDFPLASYVLDLADGLVVHSRYVEQRVRETGYEGPIWRIPHPAWRVPPPEPSQEIPVGRGPVIGCFGDVSTRKRVPQLLEAFSHLRRTFPNALLVLAGRVVPPFELDGRLEELGLRRGEHLLQLDYVEEERLWSLVAACDVCVTLRSHGGETSGMALRALSVGRPLVVSDVGWFAELPDSVGVKVPTDGWEVDILAAVLERLAGDAPLRERIGNAARAYAAREHALERVAESYAAALEEAVAGGAVRDSLLGEVARALGETGVRVDDSEVGLVAARLRELGV